jgi:O-antigen ligase
MTSLRSYPVRLLLFALPAWFTITVLRSPALPASAKLIVGAMLAAAVATPYHALLALAVTAPLGHLTATLLGAESFRMSEALVVAFLAGWILRAADDRPGPRLPEAEAAALLAFTVTASIAVNMWRLGQYRGELPLTIDQIGRMYYAITERIGFADGARILESLALMAATIAILRSRPALAISLPVALAISATIAAASSVSLWMLFAPPMALERYRRIGRVAAHVDDVNAVGSYFVAMSSMALGMTVRARGTHRLLWLLALFACGAGLRLSASRAALAAAAVVLPLAIFWFVSASWKASTRLVAIAAMLAVVLGVGIVRARNLERETGSFRQQFNETSIRMLDERPLFGVGIGQYFRGSTLFLSPQLAWYYGAENAHNYYLQMAAEIGLLGSGMFAAWLVTNLARVGHALARVPRDARLLGAAAGVVALLGTCLTGHPLLVDDVTFPFWMLFGLAVGLAGSSLLNLRVVSAGAPATARRVRFLAFVAVGTVVIAAAAAASARAAPLAPPTSPAVDGLYGWETDSDGRRYRWTTEYASLFVPASARRVYVPVKVPTDRPIGRIGVEVAVGGRFQSRTRVLDSWNAIEVALPSAAPPMRFQRIDLKMDHTWQPAMHIPGSSDTRHVGVQVGEVELAR